MPPVESIWHISRPSFGGCLNELSKFIFFSMSGFFLRQSNESWTKIHVFVQRREKPQEGWALLSRGGQTSFNFCKTIICLYFWVMQTFLSALDQHNRNVHIDVTANSIVFSLAAKNFASTKCGWCIYFKLATSPTSFLSLTALFSWWN